MRAPLLKLLDKTRRSAMSEISSLCKGDGDNGGGGDKVILVAQKRNNGALRPYGNATLTCPVQRPLLGPSKEVILPDQRHNFTYCCRSTLQGLEDWTVVNGGTCLIFCSCAAVGTRHKIGTSPQAAANNVTAWLPLVRSAAGIRSWNKWMA